MVQLSVEVVLQVGVGDSVKHCTDLQKKQNDKGKGKIRQTAMKNATPMPVNGKTLTTFYYDHLSALEKSDTTSTYVG